MACDALPLGFWLVGRETGPAAVTDRALCDALTAGLLNGDGNGPVRLPNSGGSAKRWCWLAPGTLRILGFPILRSTGVVPAQRRHRLG